MLYGWGEDLDPQALAVLQSTWNAAGEIPLLPHTRGIDEAAFKDCANPFTLTNGEELTWIMDSAFENSGYSGTFILPEGLEYIGIRPFRIV